MDQCLGRRTSVANRYHFGDGRHWVYGEMQCKNKSIEGGQLCQLCSNRSDTTLLQAQPGFPHGTIGEEYTEKSQIYDGPWYNIGVVKWGAPSDDDLKILQQYKKSIMKTLVDYFPKGKKDIVDEIIKPLEKLAVEEEPAVKPKKAKKVVQESPVEESPVEAKKAKKVVEESPVEAKKVITSEKKPKKKKEIIPLGLQKPSSKIIVAMELDEVVVPEEVVEIKLTKIKIGTKDFYWEPVKAKVYAIESTGLLGRYQGRLKNGEIIIGIPDSDEEL